MVGGPHMGPTDVLPDLGFLAVMTVLSPLTGSGGDLPFSSLVVANHSQKEPLPSSWGRVVIFPKFKKYICCFFLKKNLSLK